MKTASIIALSTLSILAAPLAAQTAAPDAASAEATIFGIEQAILTGRGKGDLSPYLNAIGPKYLGWPPTMAEPLSMEGFKRDAVNESALNGETTTMEKHGFTMANGTALAYFSTHRTMLGVGFADKDGNRIVDQRYENIHVWSWDGTRWTLVGGMARAVPDRK